MQPATLGRSAPAAGARGAPPQCAFGRPAPSRAPPRHLAADAPERRTLDAASRRTVVCCAAEPAAAAEPPAAAAAPGPKGTPGAAAWELDFCSRPILDERGKKVWELLICDADRSFEYSAYFPNNRINSAELRRALEAVLALPGARRPERVRFFRSQMQTIISRALAEMDLVPVPSRRCYALQGWLAERVESVYKQHPGYSDSAATLFTLDLGPPDDLPDRLRGEAWAFVQLPLGALRRELAAVAAGRAFGADLDLAALDALPPGGDEALVPGVTVYSRRAAPLAAWTNGLELAAVGADASRAALVLETGVNARWRYGAWRRSPEAAAEAEAWEAAKAAAGGLHFLAVMEAEDAEDCAGLWLLLDRPPPDV
jgi:hypothetical protein